MTNTVELPTTMPVQMALTDAAARQLANATKTSAQLNTITPRWLTRMLQWTPVEAGIYRLNRVKQPGGRGRSLPAPRRVRAAADLRRL